MLDGLRQSDWVSPQVRRQVTERMLAEGLDQQERLGELGTDASKEELVREVQRAVMPIPTAHLLGELPETGTEREIEDERQNDGLARASQSEFVEHLRGG